MDVVIADDGTGFSGTTYASATALVYSFVDLCGVTGVDVEIIVWRVAEPTCFECVAPLRVVIQIAGLDIDAASPKHVDGGVEQCLEFFGADIGVEQRASVDDGACGQPTFETCAFRLYQA